MSDRSQTADSETSALQDAGAAIKRETRHLAEEAKTAAKSAADQAVRDQRDALADYVSAIAHAAESGADDLDSAGYRRSAAAVSRVAEEVDGFADRLQARGPGDLLGDLEDFARDHPALVFGAGFAAAFGITRFLKSSEEGHEDFESDTSSEASPTAAAASTARPSAAMSKPSGSTTTASTTTAAAGNS